MAATFSEDILSEILKRLPVSSLIKFMLVQKSWYHLIRSSYFKALYSHHDEKITYILFRASCGHRISLRVNDKQCNQYSSVLSPEGIEWDGFGFYGISNGLICLSTGSTLKQVYFWNPVIRKYKTLRDSPILDDPAFGFVVASLAFGYLPKIDDYKVIKIERYHDKEGKPQSFVYVHVYSLSTNSWKTVKKNNFMGFENPEMDSVFVNGAAYWIGTADQLWKSSNLCLFCIEFSNGRNLGIWILENEAEIKDVWTKKFTLALDKFGETPRWWPENFRNNDEIILMKDHGFECGFMSYDIKKDEPTEVIDDLSNLFSALNVEPGTGCILASLFAENLVLLGDN
ncbi:hypothetical protein POM88_033347 [Heracleum sosnowskyi]|uniref:F-box domain-containing protein n=1 Tax=Heracleum sosnowskyi TaxID=360622 RepID=A0AAD8I109_9APIA|nr:hypothetical protein POM88_033347 [Heracleum sosnowskyi]